jgi:hypothetical protein
VVAAAEYCSGLDLNVITTTPAKLLGTGSTLKSEDRDRGSSSTDLASEFPMLARKLSCSTEQTLAQSGINSALGALNKYIGDIQTNSIRGKALLFWQRSCPNSYSVLAKFALEMLAPPASQAFVERLFSVCGIMTAGRQNRRRSSLEMRVWLKINHGVLNHHMPARKRKAVL